MRHGRCHLPRPQPYVAARPVPSGSVPLPRSEASKRPIERRWWTKNEMPRCRRWLGRTQQGRLQPSSASGGIMVIPLVLVLSLPVRALMRLALPPSPPGALLSSPPLSPDIAAWARRARPPSAEQDDCCCQHSLSSALTRLSWPCCKEKQKPTCQGPESLGACKPRPWAP